MFFNFQVKEYLVINDSTELEGVPIHNDAVRN